MATLQDVRDEVILKLTGGILELEIDDVTIDRIINASMRELNRYYDSTILINVPFSSCIDLSTYNVSSVSRVNRSTPFTSDRANGRPLDPIQAAQWQLLNGYGNVNQLSNYAMNYASWNTLMQIRNTTSTDMNFMFDKNSKKLYINCCTSAPSDVAVAYIPILTDVSQITSEHWLDILVRLSVAQTKLLLGRIRSRFTQNNALWLQDGDSLISEGTAELTELRQLLQQNNNIIYGVD